MKIRLKLRALILSLILLFANSVSSQDELLKVDNKKANNGPDLGTDIKDVVSKASIQTGGKIKIITWENLIPKGFEPEIIIKKYETEINNMSEGAEGELALLDKLMAEFNNAPSNEELDGMKVKIPGFVSPLDEKDGMVSEFLLVPYFGSCIHSPPPPVNQTVLVVPQKGKSIPIEDIYKPVWVTGKVKVERKETDLAEVGYIIREAQLEIYELDDNTQDSYQ